jgi:hypothetical protein
LSKSGGEGIKATGTAFVGESVAAKEMTKKLPWKRSAG